MEGPLPSWDELADGVIVASRDGQIVFANAAAEQLLGWARGTLAGECLVAVIPERFRLAHEAGFARHVATGRGSLLGHTLGVPALRSDGSEVEVGLVLSALADGSTVGVLRGTTRRIDVEGASGLADRLLPVLAEAKDLARTVPAMLQAIAETLGFEMAAAWEVDGELLRCVDVWEHPEHPAPQLAALTRATTFARLSGLPGRVWAAEKPMWILDLEQDDGFTRRPAALADALRSGFGFPLVHRGQVTGVVELFSRAKRVEDPHLLSVFATLGAELGGFLAARQADEERQALLRREQQARSAAEKANEEATELARILQQSLLPPTLPDVPGIEVAGRYHPAGEGLEVGGDFYDVFRTGRSSWAFSIGDVCGKGAPAAALTALVRYTARAAAMQSRSPGRVLQVVNRAMVREAQSRAGERQSMFVTMVYATLTRGREGTRVALACGGHPRPIVLRRDGTVETTDCAGALLGVFPRIEVPDMELELRSGDAVILYTDGVSDAWGPFGRIEDDGVVALARSCAGLDAEAIATRIEETAVAYQGGRSRDDIAVLVMRGS